MEGAFDIADCPTSERYALINEGKSGYCPLIDDEGYCSLQRACGENVLPMVCRMYPRSVKKGILHELSCSGSCEKTLELLTENTDNIYFEEMALDIGEDVGVETNITTAEQMKKRRLSIEQLRERSKSLYERFCSIGCIMNDDLTDIESAVPHIGENEFASLIKLIFRFEHMSDALRQCIPAALKNIGISNDTSLNEETLRDVAKKYDAAKEHLFSVLPDADIYFEKIMINHIFYEQFPYTRPEMGTSDAFLALCMAYIIIRFLSVCYMADKSEKSDFIRVIASSFRFIEHTDFYRNSVIVMRQEELGDIQHIIPLLAI